MESYGYTPHVRPRNEEIQAKVQNPKHRARRWVVEVSYSWLNRFRSYWSGSRKHVAATLHCLCSTALSSLSVRQIAQEK